MIINHLLESSGSSWNSLQILKFKVYLFTTSIYRAHLNYKIPEYHIQTPEVINIVKLVI